jgi:hypothetical protein
MARPSSLPTDPHAGSERGVRDLIGTGPGPVETGKGEESPAGADRTARIFSLLDYSRKLIFSTSILLALALGISVIAKATMNRGVLIEPISVPKELAERGITPEAAAHFIVDEMVILSDSADTLKRFDAVGTSGPEFAKTKIEVPGTGISIDTIVYYLRDFLGQSDTKISGEIIIDRPKDDSASEKQKAILQLTRSITIHFRSSISGFASPTRDTSTLNQNRRTIFGYFSNVRHFRC